MVEKQQEKMIMQGIECITMHVLLQCCIDTPHLVTDCKVSF